MNIEAFVNPVEYIMNMMSSHLDIFGIKRNIEKVEEIDKKNPYRSLRYLSVMPETDDIWFDTNKISVLGNSVYETGHARNQERIIRYTPLPAYKEMISDNCVTKITFSIGDEIIEEQGYREDPDMVVKDGYIFGFEKPTIIPPKLVKKSDLSMAVQRKLKDI